MKKILAMSASSSTQSINKQLASFTTHEMAKISKTKRIYTDLE